MSKDKDLFWKLIEPEHFKARAFCRKLTGNRDDGDDLYQDALVTALDHFATLREEAAFRSWLYRIIVNNYKNRVRRPWWKKISSFTENLEAVISGQDPELAWDARHRLEIAFRALSPEDRALITLFELQGWTAADLAQIYGQTEVNIRVRLSRTRKKMRRALMRYFRHPATGQTENLMGVKKRYALSRSSKKTG